jgi:acyl-CoA synthetase (AMP-forming)/AMP-acid ligase II
MLDRATRLAAFLADRGVAKGDRVGILFDGHGAAEAHLAFHAAHEIGAIGVPLNSRFVVRELDYVVRASGVRALVFDARFTGTVQEITSSISNIILIEAGHNTATGVDLREALAIGSGLSTVEVSLGEHDDADWIFTSGTTGRPKAVAITHVASVACGYQATEAWGIQSDSVYQSPAPFFTSTGYHTNLLGCLVAACTYIVEPEFDVHLTLERVAKYRTTSLFLVSTMIALLFARLSPDELRDADLSSLRRLCYGAQSMPSSFYRGIEEFFVTREALELVLIYGLTEAGPTGLMVPPQRHSEALSRAGVYGVPIGTQGFNNWISWRVARPNGESVDIDEVGELLLQAPSLMSRYVDDDEATIAKTAQGWLHTGDMAIVDADGFIFFVDRDSHSIRRGGLNVSSVEVESVIGDHVGIAEVAVVGRDDAVLGQEIDAFVVRAEGATVGPEELEQWCRDRLADFKVPRRFTFLDELPRNAMNRVVKTRLISNPR